MKNQEVLSNNKNNKRKKQISVFKWILFSVLFIYLAVYISVIVYTLFMSLTGTFAYREFIGKGEFIYPRPGLLIDPNGTEFANRTGWFFCNYTRVFSEFKQSVVMGDTTYSYDVSWMFSFSIIYSVICAGAYIISSTLVAYACATFRNAIAKVLETIVVMVIVFPIIGSTASEMQVIRELGFYNNFLGMFVLKFGFTNTYFLLLLSSFKLIPQSFREAAKIDGASELRIMLDVMLPVAKNSIGTVFLIQFIAFWNDYSTPVLYLPAYPTLSFGLAQFSFKSQLEGPIKMGACLLCAVPIMTLFVIFNKKLIGNVSAGGVKF